MACAHPKPSDNDLECSVCLQIYKNPKFLPCHHTFCESCIADLVRKSGNRSVPCPVCREPTNLSLDQVPQLQSNFYVAGRLPDNTLICQSHRSEKFRFLCITCHSQPLCCKCLLPDHARHDLQDLDEAIAEAQTRLQKMESDLRSSIKQQRDELEKLKKTEDTTRKTREDLKTAFINRADILKKQIDCALEASLRDLEELSVANISSLEEAKASMETKLSQAQQLEQTVDKTLAEANYVNMAQLCHGQGSTNPLTSVVYQPELIDIVQDFDDSESNLSQVKSFVGRARKVRVDDQSRSDSKTNARVSRPKTDPLVRNWRLRRNALVPGGCRGTF